jgi:hypothetical protein
VSGKALQFDQRLDPLLDVLVDEFFARLESAQAESEPNKSALPEAQA